MSARLGEEVVLDTVRYVVTSIYAEGTMILTPIPDGLTVLDLGRRFFALAIVSQGEWSFAHRSSGSVN